MVTFQRVIPGGGHEKIAVTTPIIQHFHEHLIPFLWTSLSNCLDITGAFLLTWRFGALKNDRISAFFLFSAISTESLL